MVRHNHHTRSQYTLTGQHIARKGCLLRTTGLYMNTRLKHATWQHMAIKVIRNMTQHNQDIKLNTLHNPNWLLNAIKSRKLTYFGHLKRHDTLEKHILEAKLQGKRRKGRPARKWTDDIKEWLSIDVVQAGRKAHNREVFRRMVREATSTKGKPR